MFVTRVVAAAPARPTANGRAHPRRSFRAAVLDDAAAMPQGDRLSGPSPACRLKGSHRYHQVVNSRHVTHNASASLVPAIDFGSKGAYVSTSFPALPPLGSCLTQQAISQGVTRSQSLRNDTFETHSAYRDPSIAFRQTGLKSSHERRPYAGRANLSEPAPPSFAAILAIPWLPFAAGECAMESKQFARSSRLAKQNGERAAMQHHTSSAAASQKSECGHIKCDMGHPPGCHNGLAICSCRGVSTIYDRFRRRGKWFDFQAKNLIFSGPDRDRKRRGSLAISRLSVTAWAGTDHDLRLAVGSSKARI